MSTYKRLPKENWNLFYELFTKRISNNSLPIASSTQAGVVKIGEGLDIVGDTLICTISSSGSESITFEDFTSQDVQDIFKEGD